MKKAKVYLKSVTPYSQGKYVTAPKKDKELHQDYEDRTWRERLHYNGDNTVFIPPMQFCNSLKEAAKYLNVQIPGKGKNTYTKHFDSGVLVTEPLELGINKDDVPCESVHVPSDGRRGGTTRVLKNFPVIPKWEGWVTFYILDPIITEDIFTEVLRECGNLIGIGRFRPRNRGYYGRFEIDKLEWFEQ